MAVAVAGMGVSVGRGVEVGFFVAVGALVGVFVGRLVAVDSGVAVADSSDTVEHARLRATKAVKNKVRRLFLVFMPFSFWTIFSTWLGDFSVKNC